VAPDAGGIGSQAAGTRGKQMRSTSRWAAALVVAAIALACAAGTAGASRELGNEGGRTIESIDRAFTMREPGGLEIICELEVFGIMQTANIRKMRGAAAGTIFRSEARGCTNSTRRGVTTVRPLVEERMPWPMTFDTFAGTLPAITEVRLMWRMALLISIEPGMECLYDGVIPVTTAGELAARSFTIRRFTLQAGNRIPLFRVLIQELMKRCPASLELRGSFVGERVRVVIILIN
jgi:hypothetical protein